MSREGQGRKYGAETTTIQLNEVEIKDLATFAQQHAKCDKPGNWPIQFVITATATGIGSAIEVTCKSCKEVGHISDVSSW